MLRHDNNTHSTSLYLRHISHILALDTCKISSNSHVVYLLKSKDLICIYKTILELLSRRCYMSRKFLPTSIYF